MVSSSLLVPALAVSVGVACAPRPWTGRRETWEDRRANLLQERAAFDLQCPKPQLRTQELGKEEIMGVAGCGRRAVYLYDFQRSAWIMNGAIDAEQPGGPGSTDITNPPPVAPRVDASGNPGGTTL